MTVLSLYSSVTGDADEIAKSQLTDAHAYNHVKMAAQRWRSIIPRKEDIHLYAQEWVQALRIELSLNMSYWTFRKASVILLHHLSTL